MILLYSSHQNKKPLMPITFDTAITSQTLHITTKGTDDNLEEVLNYSQAVLELAIKNNSRRILCDERALEYTISIPDTYELAENLSVYATQVARVAIVCNEKYLEIGKFYETVASNRGLIIHVTSDYNDAKTWLNK